MTTDTGQHGDLIRDVPPGIEVTGPEQRAAWQRRELPPVERLAGGIWSVPVAFPDNPLRYTLSYVVPGDTGVVVIDPGWRSDEGWDTLVSGLSVAGMTVQDVVGIVVTHIHPDHHGLSGRLRDASGAWVGMHPAERDTLPGRSVPRLDPDGFRERIQQVMRVSGGTADDVDAFVAGFDDVPHSTEIPELIEPDLLLEDGDAVPLPGRRLYAVWTPGHTPGHLCLREPDARVLLTGDCVLPRITPNLGLGEDGSSPLPSFLDSLRRLADYDDYEALPAHEYRFRGMANRSVQLREHHERRCREIAGVVDERGEVTMMELARHLTWSRPWSEVGRMQVAALGETMAHAVYLVELGELEWSVPGGLLGDRQPARLRRAIRS